MFTSNMPLLRGLKRTADGLWLWKWTLCCVGINSTLFTPFLNEFIGFAAACLLHFFSACEHFDQRSVLSSVHNNVTYHSGNQYSDNLYHPDIQNTCSRQPQHWKVKSNVFQVKNNRPYRAKHVALGIAAASVGDIKACVWALVHLELSYWMRRCNEVFDLFTFSFWGTQADSLSSPDVVHPHMFSLWGFIHDYGSSLGGGQFIFWASSSDMKISFSLPVSFLFFIPF